MPVAANIDCSARLETSAFSTSIKEVSKQIQETFGVSGSAATGIAKLEASLQKQIETWKMSGNELAIYKLKIAGASEASLEQARALASQLDAAQKFDKQLARGTELYNSTRTAEEKRAQQIAELNDLLAAGAINQDVYNRSVKALTPPKIEVKPTQEWLDLERRGKAVVESLKTETDKYMDKLDELSKLRSKGIITEKQFAAAVKAVPKPQTEAQVKAQKEYQALMDRGAALIKSQKTETQKYKEVVDDLNKMLEKGIISKKQYNKALESVPRPKGMKDDILSGIQSGGTMLLTGLGAAATATAGAIAAIGSSAVAAGASLATMVNNTINAVDATNDLAESLGVNVSDLSRLQYAVKLTGGSVEAVGGTMRKLAKNISDAGADAASESAGAFRELGISVEDIAKANPSEQFYRFADAIAKLQNPADRTAYAMKLGGKQAVELINSLGAGGATLRQFGAESDKFGNTIGQGLADAAARANDAKDRLGALFAGVSNQITDTLAPILEKVVVSFIDFGTEGNKASLTVALGLEVVKKSMAETWSLARQGGAAAQLFAGGLSKAFSLVLSGRDKKVFAGIGEDLVVGGLATGFRNGKQEAEDFFAAIERDRKKADAIAAKARKEREAANALADAKERAGRPQAALTEGLKKENEELDKQIALIKGLYGASSQNSKLYDLEKAGASPAQLEELKNKQKYLDLLTEQKKKQDEIEAAAKKSLEASITDPFEQFAKKVEEIKQSKKLTDAEKKQATKGAYYDTVGKDKSGGKLAGYAEQGSVAARSAILSTLYGKGPDDLQRELLRVNKRIADNTSKTAATLDKQALKPSDDIINIA